MEISEYKHAHQKIRRRMYKAVVEHAMSQVYGMDETQWPDLTDEETSDFMDRWRDAMSRSYEESVCSECGRSRYD